MFASEMEVRNGCLGQAGRDAGVECAALLGKSSWLDVRRLCDVWYWDREASLNRIGSDGTVPPLTFRAQRNAVAKT